jgi:hypothetical protein
MASIKSKPQKAGSNSNWSTYTGGGTKANNGPAKTSLAPWGKRSGRR